MKRGFNLISSVNTEHTFRLSHAYFYLVFLICWKFNLGITIEFDTMKVKILNNIVTIALI